MSQYTPSLAGHALMIEFLTVGCLFLGHDADMIECQNKQRIPDNSTNPSQLIY